MNLKDKYHKQKNLFGEASNNCGKFISIQMLLNIIFLNKILFDKF